MKFKSILVIMFFFLFSLTLTSAWTDSTFTKDTSKINEKSLELGKETTTNYGTYLIERSQWWDVLKIWTKEPILEIKLNENTDTCGGDVECLGSGETTLYKDGKIFKELIWKRSFDNQKSWVDWNSFTNWNLYIENKDRYIEQPIYKTTCVDKKDGKISLNGTVEQECNSEIIDYETIDAGEWILYDWNKEYKADSYKYEVRGNKKSSTILDWMLVTEEGSKVLSEWAVWGNISLGDEAEVVLISPADGSTSLTSSVTLNATANVTAVGVYLVNMSECDNITGSWGCGDTIHFSQIGGAGSVSYYKLDETSGTNALDSHGVYNATATNEAVFTGSSEGKIGVNSANFSVGNYKIDMPLPNMRNQDKSISLWIKYGGLTNSFERVFTFEGTEQLPLTFRQDSGIPRLTLWSNYNNEEVWFGVGNLTVGNWHHIALVYDYGTNVYLYLDGNLISQKGSAPQAVSASSSSTSIGGVTGNDFWLSKSMIDEVGVWNRSLNSTEISLLYNSGAGSRIIGDATSYTNTWSKTIPAGTTKWNVQACDSDGDCGYAVNNFTVSLDATPPSVVINSGNGTQNYGSLVQNHTINFTVTDDNLDSVWFNYNGTNTTITGATSGVMNSTSFALVKDLYTATIYANDTAGNVQSQFVSWDYKVFENSRTFNSSSFETANEGYSINVSSNSSLTGVSLLYNSTSYAMTKSGSVWSYSRDLPTSVLGNNSVSYRFTYQGDTINSNYLTYQYVNTTNFTHCLSGTPYVNFTFKDEADLSTIQARIQSSNFEYYLGTGTETKSLLYSNNTANSNYAFCSNRPDRTLYVTPDIIYLNDSYPARTYQHTVQTYTNSTTNKTLYLLSQNDGIYVTFVVVTQSNIAIPDATITATRSILGTDVTIAQGTTDSSGGVTFWLNPIYSHSITASKTGYGSTTESITPTQSTYTLTLSTSSSEYNYVSNTKGLLWGIFPSIGIINESASRNYGFNVSSYYGNLTGCKIELLNNDKTVSLASAEEVTANETFCSVQVSYTVDSTYPQIKGRLLVDLGSGYEILEEDAYWVLLEKDTTGMTFTDWFNGLTNLDLSYFGNNEQHREYTNILVFFLVAMIICASLSMTGWDLQTGGGIIYLMAIFVWIASVPGFLNLAGISPFALIDKFFVAIVYTMFCIGFVTRNI